MANRNWCKLASLVVAILFILAAAVDTNTSQVVASQDDSEQQQRKPFEPEMVFIKSGKFKMGSPSSEKNRESDEPVHDVTVSDFYMGRYEVTFAQYDTFCEATGKSKPDDLGWGRGNRPVINVTWNDATAYCEWLSKQTGKTYRLPTEAEWEYACRAGTTTKYSHGDSESGLGSSALYSSNSGDRSHEHGDSESGLGSSALYSSNSGDRSHEVGTKQPNSWGLYDMHGNVWEWCSDRYDLSYYGTSPRNDPQGTSSGSSRVLRDGGWYFNPWPLRSAYRVGRSPDDSNSYFGFRVCRSVPAK